MSKFRAVFPLGKVFLPVIHVENLGQAKRNVAVALGEGGDGVWLISHGDVESRDLRGVFRQIHDDHPSVWLGINFLDLKTFEAVFFAPSYASGLWVDDGGYQEDKTDRTDKARWYAENWSHAQCKGLYFGSVAFKGQNPVEEPEKAGRSMVPYVDVVVTSGTGTGFAPPLEKIKAMKRAVGEHPLAIASGMTPANVRLFLPFADCFMVATGISRSFTELDPGKVREFARALGK